MLVRSISCIKAFFIGMIFCSLSFLVSAQESSTCILQGSLRDSINNTPLIGVNIYLKSTLEGTVSDTRGHYSIRIPSKPGIIVFSYVGYKTKEILVMPGETLELNISLQATETHIEAVEIKAQREFFGNLEKGRSIQKVSPKDIALETSGNVSDVLHARLSGIWATKTSGAPGDHIKIRVRGMSSLFASDDPLYVVDGVQVPNVNLKSLGVAHLNINDIENITVLKDASSTALYGYQGGNGVIIIDTKRGGGENEINFSTKQGIQRFTNFYDLMNTRDYLASMDSSKKINRTGIRGYYPRYNDSLVSMDWQDEIFQDGLVNEYQLSASGTLGKSNYYLSGNYYNHSGIVKKSSYNKYNFAANLGRKFGERLKVEMSFKYNAQENKNNLDNYMGNDLLYAGINKPPCLNDIPDSLFVVTPALDTLITNYTDYSMLREKYDPNDYLSHVHKQLDIAHYSAHLFLNYRITDNLNFNFSTSFSGRNQVYTLNTESFYFGGPAYYLRSDENYRVVNHQYNLRYTKESQNHSLKAVVGIKSYTDNVYWKVDSSNYPYKEYDVAFETGSAISRGTMAIHGVEGAVIRTITSYVSHVNYSYKHRYNLSLALNYDRLKEGNYVQIQELFPSVAVNWNLTRENWFPFSWVNSLNLYSNFGIAGNYPLNALSNDLYLPRIYTYIDSNSDGYIIDQLANHHLRHETVTESNTGIELSVLNERITIKTDFFNKINSKLIMNRIIPEHYGGGNLFLNVGEIRSKGLDFGLEGIPISKSKFNWQTRLNLSWVKQRIAKLDVEDTLVFHSFDLLFPEFRLIKDGELGDIYGYRYLGKYNPNTEYKNLSEIAIVKGGMFLNADTNSYSGLGMDDIVKIGNSMPNFTCNFASSMTYKKFSMDMLWYGVFGVQKYNASRAASYITATNSEINELITDSVGVFLRDIFYQSSFFVEDASFIRLKNLSFSYKPDKMMFNRVKAIFTISFDNLITITRYKGFDPEATIYSDNTFSDNAVDRGAYPIPKAVYITISLKL